MKKKEKKFDVFSSHHLSSYDIHFSSYDIHFSSYDIHLSSYDIHLIL